MGERDYGLPAPDFNRSIHVEARPERLAWVPDGLASQPTMSRFARALSIEVHGPQVGAEYNGHDKAAVFDPLVAVAAETGDLLDVRLRPGRVHPADGALDFILDLVDHAEAELRQVASVRFDAGFPSEKLLSVIRAQALTRPDPEARSEFRTLGILS
ncbi:MAG: hypothetical protein CSA66_02590 [Proteobacteria bacterium]|nr:MAG: hypothetical protein CSA66_02590 [Pseudomonadota bacterium]